MPDSATVGTSGSAPMRVAPLTAMAFKRPSLTKGSTATGVSNMTLMRPAIRSVSAGGEPL